MAKDLKSGRKAIERLSDALRDTDALANQYAESVLLEAQQRAAGRPTPQASMVAEAMGVQGDTIRVLSGGDPAAVAYGSELGSSIYTQFGPRNEGGYWLFPSGESPEAKDAGDRYLEDIISNAVRGFGF